MLVDVHSHYFKYPDHFTEDFREQSRKGRNMEIDLTVRWEEYHRAATECDRTVVFGGKARLSGLWVPDQDVAGYANQHPDKLIGFLSLDPTQPGWQDELHQGHRDLRLKGIKLLPMYAGFRPNQPELDYLWEYATRHSLPVLLHTGTTFVDKAPLECTFPRQDYHGSPLTPVRRRVCCDHSEASQRVCGLLRASLQAFPALSFFDAGSRVWSLGQSLVRQRFSFHHGVGQFGRDEKTK